MNQKEGIDEEIRKKYESLLYYEEKYGIFTALQWYESLNLKKIAQIVGRPETTTIRYLKQLVDDGLIDIDVEKTATSWGKFYKLSTSAKNLYEEEKKEMEMQAERYSEEFKNFEKSSEEELTQRITNIVLSKENMNKLSTEIKQMIHFTSNIQHMIVNNFIFTLNELNNLIDKKGLPYLKENLLIDPGDITQQNFTIRYSTTKHLIKILAIYLNIRTIIKKLEEEINRDLVKEKVPENKIKTYIINLFMGSTEFTYKLKK